MPNREYQCSWCGTKWELFERMDDPPAKECPTCGHPTAVRLISLCAFHLKGDGWPGKEAKEGKKP